MKMENKEILEALENEGISTTQQIEQAIYIMTDGQMISGNFVDGSRTEDHRCVEILFEDTDRYDTGFWNKVVQRTGLVQYVPETAMILLKSKQELTSAQQAIIDKHGLEVDYF